MAASELSACSDTSLDIPSPQMSAITRSARLD